MFCLEWTRKLARDARWETASREPSRFLDSMVSHEEADDVLRPCSPRTLQDRLTDLYYTRLPGRMHHGGGLKARAASEAEGLSGEMSGCLWG